MRKAIKLQRALLLVAALIMTLPVRPAAAEQGSAASDATARPANSAPRIGLALGGGGAKGAAHIGVLKVLEELRVPISCIAGTSMGALIGGSYAAGNTAEEIEQTVLGIDWQRTIGGRDQRKLMPIERKNNLQNYSNSLEVGIRNGGIKGSGGIIKTQIIEDQIRTLVSRVPATGDFDDLPIPFRATATEMVRGELAVIGEGNVAQAMRASMALPGIFAPVRIGEQVLGDGGMMRNLPVDIVREQCADVVIAVWMTMPDPDPDNIVSTVSMLNRSFEVMVGANEAQSIASLGDADIGIAVPMGDMTSQDFLRVADAARFGEEEARRHIDELRKYSVPEEEYVAWRQSVEGELYGDGHIREIRVVGSDRVNPDYVMANLRYAAPDVWIDAEKLALDAEYIFALGDFERVDYRVYAGENGNVLEIRPVEKHWGPDFLRFDIGLATLGESDIQAILNLEHERTWINSLGGRWRNELQFGRNTIASTSFYQPFDAKQRFFVEPIAHYESNIEDLYVLDDRAASIDVRDLYAQLDFGYNMGSRAQLRVGVRRGAEEAKVSTGIPGLVDLPRRYYTSGQFRAIYDTRNSVALPTSGTYFNARYVDSFSSLGGDEDFRSIEGILSKAFLLNGNSLSFVVSGGDAPKGNLPVSRDIKLGGIRTFPGLRPGELRGSQYWYAGGSYLWRVADLAELFGQAIYAGVRVQTGEVRGAPVGLNQGQLWGVSGTLNGQTPVGAFTLSLAWVSNDNIRLQFSLGRPILEGSILDESH